MEASPDYRERPDRVCVLPAQDDHFRLGAINVVSLENGLVKAIDGFLDPAYYHRPPGDLADR